MIEAYMTDPVTIVKSGGYDQWKEPLPSTDVAVMGRFEFKTRLVKNIEGEEVVSRATVYFAGTIDAALSRALIHEDMIKYNTVVYAIINIGTPKAFDDPHYEVFLS